MLIRQKAGWRLHHQAYLWPRRGSRSPLSPVTSSPLSPVTSSPLSPVTSSPLSPVTSSLLQPRRRRSNASTGSSGTHSESDCPSPPTSLQNESDSCSPTTLLQNESDSCSPTTLLQNESDSCSPPTLLRSERDSFSPPISLRSESDSSSPPISLRRSSSSSCIEGEELSRVLPLWSRGRTDSNGAEDTPYPSPAYSEESSPRKRKASSGSDCESVLVSADEAAPCRHEGNSSGHTLQDASAHVPHKRRKRSCASDSSDEVSPPGSCPIVASSEGLGRDHEDESSHADSQCQMAVQTRSEYVCSDIRTRRDTRGCDSRGAESTSSHSSSHLNHFSSLKGSNASGCNDSSSGNNNNNHLPHCDNSYTSTSLKESGSLRESNSGSDTTGICSRLSRMGVLCTEKHDVGERCECEGMSANSPRPATLHCFPSSPCETNGISSQECAKSFVSRKRSLDAALNEASDSGTAVIRRRTQRSPSVGSINGFVAHPAAIKDKLSSEVAIVIGQNGLKQEFGPNGVRVPNGYQNGTRPHCCLGLNTRTACTKCMAHHHPAVVATSISSPQLQSPSSLQPAPLACHNGRAVGNCHGQGSAVALPHSTSASILSVGSTAHIAMDDPHSAKRPQPPSSLLQLSTSSTSSPAASASQQQQLHQPTQGSASSNIGSSNHNSSSDSDDKDGLSSNTAVASSKCISASPNPTVLSLRQRQPSSNSAQKSLSQPPSPQASASMPCKSKSLVTSSSLPSLSTLVAEPASPVTPPTVPCRWRGCSCHLDTSDLLEHIRKHVETQIEKKTYACLWADCKVFNKPSWSGSWLERHVVSHSGHRPFKCILDNCGQRFHSQAALERHVNGHFTAPSQNGVKSGRTREEISHRMLQKRKRQLKRRFVQTVKRNDIFDDQTMILIKQDLVSLAEETRLDLSGCVMHTTFHGSIVGRRSTQSGSKQSLVEFIPSNVLENQWVPEEASQQVSKMSVPLFGLPKDTVSNLHNSLYKPHRFRKHRRK